MIKIENLDFSYKNNRRVFNRMNLNLDEPGIYGLLGENGVGKTTLLNLMGSMLLPQGGSITMNGTDGVQRKVSDRDVETLAATYLLSDKNQLSSLRFKDFVNSYSRFYPNYSSDTMKDGIESFHIDVDMKLKHLSLGNWKRAMIAMALAVGTDLLLMDEPTNGLDIPAKKTFRQLLMKHMRDEQTVVISTHQIADIDKMIDHVIILKDGHDAFCASTEEILKVYAFTVQPTDEGALYSEVSAGGYKVIRKNDGQETDINLELLFNAVINGGLK